MRIIVSGHKYLTNLAQWLTLGFSFCSGEGAKVKAQSGSKSTVCSVVGLISTGTENSWYHYYQKQESAEFNSLALLNAAATTPLGQMKFDRFVHVRELSCAYPPHCGTVYCRLNFCGIGLV